MLRAADAGVFGFRVPASFCAPPVADPAYPFEPIRLSHGPATACVHRLSAQWLLAMKKPPGLHRGGRSIFCWQRTVSNGEGGSGPFGLFGTCRQVPGGPDQAAAATAMALT